MNLVQIGIYLIVFGSPTNALGFYRLGNIYKNLLKEKNNTHEVNDAFTISTAWIKQPLDHFDEKENRTWKMRYFKSLDLWKSGGPLYIYLNGEWEGTEAVFSSGLLHELTKETSGAIYATEHRYYGNSRPFKELNTKNLAYLSSRQALADVAILIKEIRKSSRYTSSKVVAVGGSYAGNLAAWMRFLYPELVDAAIASSAPLLVKKDFYEYLESVSDGFEHYGTSGCYNAIRNMFRRYEQFFQTNAGIDKLKQEEEICNITDMSKPENKQIFFSDKVIQFMYEVQYGNPDSIKVFCEDMRFPRKVRQSAKEDEFSLWSKTKNCFNYDFDNMIESMKQVDWVTAWTYQTCTEFGYFPSSSSKKHPFTNNIPIELFYDVCSKMYGSEFDEKRVDKGIRTTNEIYGSFKSNISYVVFLNGELDPWARLGIVEDISYYAPAKVIPRSSHCSDLFSDSMKDSEELKEAKTYVKYLLKEWISRK